jgi:hypothetical protein
MRMRTSDNQIHDMIGVQNLNGGSQARGTRKTAFSVSQQTTWSKERKFREIFGNIVCCIQT